MSKSDSSGRERLLPTYRWDETDTLSGSSAELVRRTSRLLADFLLDNPEAGSLPPQSVIRPIARMNVQKRTSAIRQAEAMIEAGDIVAPPPSLIPTFMVSGHSIVGLEDGYMQSDHPSQELFAYNRLGKRSWLNAKFGDHCMKAVGFAHPGGHVQAAKATLRAKAHSPSIIAGGEGDDEWAVVSTKLPIAVIKENGRQASLITRVTGAVDLTSPELSRDETEAITWLANRESLHEHETSVVLGQKAILGHAIERLDGTDKNPFHPVVQTVYLTQQAQTR